MLNSASYPAFYFKLRSHGTDVTIDQRTKPLYHVSLHHDAALSCHEA